MELAGKNELQIEKSVQLNLTVKVKPQINSAPD